MFKLFLLDLLFGILNIIKWTAIVVGGVLALYGLVTVLGMLYFHFSVEVPESYDSIMNHGMALISLGAIIGCIIWGFVEMIKAMRTYFRNLKRRSREI